MTAEFKTYEILPVNSAAKVSKHYKGGRLPNCKMMKHIIILFVFVTFCTISCNKGPLDSGDAIEAYANKLNGPDMEAFKLRAAFAKTVARAFGNEHFRAYFKREFCMLTENHFKELVVSQHLDDEINSNGLTLKQLLEASFDSEVKHIFGNNLITEVIAKDPCVVIKLPDLFRNFEWKTADLIPMVMPVTPKPELTFGESLFHMPFFYNGNYDVIYDPMTYFHCTLKYSEDYFLLDPNTFTNEKGISFYECLPQVADAPDMMKAEICAMGEPAKAFPGKLFINKRRAFNLWQEKYAYKGTFLYKSTTCANQQCIRECIDPEKSVLVLDTFQVNLSRIFEYLTERYLEESTTFTFVFWSSLDDHFMRQIYIPALPYEYFEAREISIKLTENNKCKPPTIEYNRKEKGYGKPFAINALIREHVHKSEIIHLRSDFQLYSDEIGQWVLNHPLHNKTASVSSTFSFHEQVDFILGCDQPARIHTSQSWFSFNY